MIAEWIAASMIVALTVYALSGGADFGGGVWDLLASGKRRDDQKKVIADAIAPIWEANHVWLIFVVVVLFTGFPKAFSAIATLLHIPLTFLLIGVVFRGAAFAFRSYAPTKNAAQRWGRVFAIASVLTPIALGIIIGAISSGSMNMEALDFLHSWLHAFGFSVGFLTLALFAYLAAVYLTTETEDRELQENFRKRALISAFLLAPIALLVYLLSFNGSPYIQKHLSSSWWTWPLQIGTGLFAIGAIVSLFLRRYRLAVLCARVQVTLILWGWAFAQYPYLVLPNSTIRESAANARTLEFLAYGIVAGALILVPSFYILIRVFKKSNRQSGIFE